MLYSKIFKLYLRHIKLSSSHTSKRPLITFFQVLHIKLLVYSHIYLLFLYSYLSHEKKFRFISHHGKT